jgi:probable rRNA maturation factor
VNTGEVSIETIHPSLRIDEQALERLVRRVVRAESAELRFLGIILADHDTVLALNRDFLQHDFLTDVLSFPLTDEAGVVDGEVYVDLDTAAERHPEFEASFEEEVRRYAVHGVLHLLGYVDVTPDERESMHALEDRYLADTN